MDRLPPAVESLRAIQAGASLSAEPERRLNLPR